MMRIVFFLIFMLPVLCYAQKETYQIYNAQAKQVNYSKLLKKAHKADIVLFGEFHDNPIIHWLQLELTKDLFALDSNLVLGAEMMESDNQLIIDEYLAGYYSSKKLISESKTWTNFETDYLPLIDFTKENKLDFIATNIPRRYASMVYSFGIDTLESLSEQAKSLIAPLPIKIDTSLVSYKEMLAMGMGHGGDNLPKSQAIKDATMAHFISKNIPDTGKFIHFHGAFHSKNYEGIYWYLKDLNPELEILTIGSEEQENIFKLNEAHDKADFIIVTPTNMTKTH
jgi:uncharacterized iron-regulated protein